MMRKKAIWPFLSLLLVVATAAALDRSSDATHKGYARGYRDGFRHARDDKDSGQGYDNRARNYDGTIRGYDPSMGSQTDYNNGYTIGFTDGYDDGYNGRRNRVAA